MNTLHEGLICASASVPNLLGRGEKLESRVKFGNFGSQHFSMNYTLPIRNNLLWKMNSDLCGSSFMASLYRNYRKMSWSSLQGTIVYTAKTLQGMIFGWNFYSNFLRLCRPIVFTNKLQRD